MEATVHIRRDGKSVVLSEMEFLGVYGNYIKPEERVMLRIGNYNIFMTADNAESVIADKYTAEALDKFPAVEEEL